MKLACASSAFDGAIRRGDLTQLEFIDCCARELACDGVVLDVRHFPRTDGDYLAQVKKMAADTGLCIAAVQDDAFFSYESEEMALGLEHATLLGAPLLGGRLARETRCSWGEQLARLNAATAAAKAVNVTLAVRNAPQTFAATVHDCKRTSKEADSAWLRFGLEPAAFDAASDASALAAKTVLIWEASGGDPATIVDRAEPFEPFRGHLVFDRPDGEATAAEMQRAIRNLRIARAKRLLDRT